MGGFWGSSIGNKVQNWRNEADGQVVNWTEVWPDFCSKDVQNAQCIYNLQRRFTRGGKAKVISCIFLFHIFRCTINLILFYLSKSERAALRLAAGCAMLRICETQDVGDVYTLDQFFNLSHMVIDPCKQVAKISSHLSNMFDEKFFFV